MNVPFPAANRVPAPAPVRPIRRRSPVARARRIARYAITVTGTAIFLFPLAWMLLTALKRPDDIYVVPPQILPHAPHWTVFLDTWTSQSLGQYALNSVVVAGGTLAGVLLSSSLCAFGFARLRFLGRDIIFLCLLASVMLPWQVTLIPLYIIFNQLHWLDSYKPLVVPAWFGGGALNIFLLRQAFLTLPRELDEAARIDGCSTFGLYRRIALPLVKPALLVVTILTFQRSWTEFLGPLIYLNSPGKYTLALAVSNLQSEAAHGGMNEATVMAAALIMVLPVALVFLVAQRFIASSAILSGFKG
jgi:ABC-type glycerol-3-phosphate transport system permease component